MGTIAGDNSEQEITIPIDEALCSVVFKAKLLVGDFHLLNFDFVSGMVTMLSSSTPDKVVTYLRDANYQADARPCVLVVPSDTTDTLDEDILERLGAILLPAHPQFLMPQLDHIVSLQKQNHKLKDDIDTLESYIATQKRKTSEIDLLKNAIVRNVSHELRTPLLQVKSAVSLIGEDATDKKLFNYAQDAVARLETHIKNITMLGHSLDSNISPIILRDAVEYAKRNLTRIWTRRGDVERIHVKLEDQLPPILADKQGLSTVLQLLMDNALKFGGEENIEIIGRKSREKVYIAVRDHGIGIAKDRFQDIFESFYQVDDTSTRPYGGAGVGLALVKLILDNHQVKIHVESTLDKGSTFWFELPYINIETFE